MFFVGAGLSVLSRVVSWWRGARASAAISPPQQLQLPVAFTRTPDYWRRCGRIETKKEGMQIKWVDGKRVTTNIPEEWKSDGQCVVVHALLLLTAAHVLFYEADAEEDDAQHAPSAKTTRSTAASSAKKPAAASAASAAGAIPAGARSDARHSAKWVPFPHIRAVFVEPIVEDGRVVGRTQHIFQCEAPPLRYSDSMDAAVLRIQPAQTGQPTLVPFRVAPLCAVTAESSVSLVAFKHSQARMPHIIPGTVLYLEERAKKHGSGGHFTIGETNYLVQAGFSGGGVVRQAADGVWELVGMHTGTDYLGYGDEAVRTEQGRNKRKSTATVRPSQAASSRIAPATPRRLSHSSSTATDGTVSYEPSDEEGPAPVVPIDQTTDALIHAQTNSARATFFVAASVLVREHWSISYMLTLPATPTHGDAAAADNSPPRKRRGGTSARSVDRCSSIAEEEQQ
jgi:hypothetical protein